MIITKIQLAIDSETFGTAIQKVTLLRDYIEVIEMGTGFLYRYGLQVIKEFKQLFPEKKILADMKLVDGGKHLAKEAFDMGADIVTVLATGERQTIAGAVEAANESGKEVYADLISVWNIGDYRDKLDSLGVHYVCAHLAIDAEKDRDTRKFLEDVRQVKFAAKLVIAGGVNEANIDSIKACDPYMIVVGRAITKAPDIVTAAKKYMDA